MSVGTRTSHDWNVLVWLDASAEGHATITGHVGAARLSWAMDVVSTL